MSTRVHHMTVAGGDTEAVRRAYRRVAGRFPTGVTIVGTLADGEPHAATVNSFTSVSMDPLLVLVSLATTSRTLRHVRGSGVFAVTVLGAHQEDAARWFAHADRPTGAPSFAGRNWHPGPCTGSPVLADGVGFFDCVVDGVHTAGDHHLVIGGVCAFGGLSDDPSLLFTRSRFVPLPNPG
jgi:flavin reductase (DIM6/NTAB) family NADH-FMN oxidoreductase RutF